MSQFKTLITLIATTFSATAFAEGSVCTGITESLRVRVYNSAENSVMIVSDPSVAYGRQTIARFALDKGTLSTTETSYIGQVDRRFNELSREGENIGGTKLGELRQVILELGHEQNTDGDLLAKVMLVKRNGSVLEHRMTCVDSE